MNNNWHIKIEDCNEAQKEVLKRVYGNQILRCRYFGFNAHGNIFLYVTEPDAKLITPEQAFERLGLDVKPTEMGVKRYKESIARLEQENIELNQQGELVAHELHDAEQKIKELEQQLQCVNPDSERRISFLEAVNEGCIRELGKRNEIISNLQHKMRKLEKRIIAAKPYDFDWSLMPDHVIQIAQHNQKGSIVYLTSDDYENNRGLYRVIATRPKPKYTQEQIQAVEDYEEWKAKDRSNNCYTVEEWLKEVGNE